jgi:hypothetical protein
VFVYFVFNWFYKASISVTYLAITVNTIWFCDEDFSSSFCSLCFSVSGVCLFCTLHFLNWVCWVRGNFSGEPGHVYITCVCLRCVEWRAGSILFDHCGGVGGGAVQVFRLLLLCSGGYSTVEMVRGVVRFSLLSSVCCQFSWRLDICGRNLLCYIL